MERFKTASFGDKVFYIVITLVLTLFFLAVLYPCVYVVSAAFSSGEAVNAGKVVLLPVNFSVESFKLVLSDPDVYKSFLHSIFYMAAGTLVSVALTLCAAYCLARRDFPGGGFFMLLFTFTMFFSGGMIPKYLLVSRLRMTNTIWAVILPSCISVYNLIVTRTFMANSIPKELFDAAMVDGCSDFGYFFRIVLPLSKSIIAVLVLFFGVSRWNAYFEPMLYLTKRSLYPLSLIVREYLILSKFDASNIADPEKATKINEIMGGMKYALIVISTVPVMVLYPFVQKHFAKGVMIGSIKG
jgi:multiple sugar transport system permease protein/putative aldouronate transport system permease protein